MLVFVLIMIVWNGRRIVKAVIMPTWAFIRHYTDLQSAISYVLVPLVAILAAWFTPTDRPHFELHERDNNNQGIGH